jgi:DNA-binding transcriptional LysR family regulator
LANPPRRLRIHAPSLRYFDAVRRAGSIRGAARQLNLASSAVNRQILHLEAEIGGPLFDRLPGGLRLTSAGEVVAQHVLTVLRDAERAESELDGLRGLRRGHVDLVTLEGLCHRIVPEATAGLQARHARVTVAAAIRDSRDIPGAVIAGEAHLGLAFEVRRHPVLRQLAMVRLPLGAVVPPDSPLAGRPVIGIGDCVGSPLVLPQRNFANREQLEPLLAQAGMLGQVRCEAGSVELMKQVAMRGLGIAFMTRVGLEADLETGRLVHVPLQHGGRPLFSELGLYARASPGLPAAADAFAQHLMEAMARTGVSGAA